MKQINLFNYSETVIFVIKLQADKPISKFQIIWGCAIHYYQKIKHFALSAKFCQKSPNRKRQNCKVFERSDFLNFQ